MRKRKSHYIVKLLTGLLGVLGLYLLPLVIGLSWLGSNPDSLLSWVGKGLGLRPSASALSIDFEEWRYLNINTYRFKVTSSQHTSPLARVKRLSLRWDLYQLLQGDFVLERVLIDSPKLVLSISDSGDIQFGPIRLFSPDMTGSDSSVFQFHVGEFELSNGRLALQFPEDLDISTFHVNHLNSKTIFNEGQQQFLLDGNIYWQRKQGELRLAFEESNGVWSGQYKAEVPLSPLWIPPLADYLERMPLGGIFRLDGDLTIDASNHWDSKFEWGIDGAALISNTLPDRKLYISSLGGKGSLLSVRNGSRLRFHLDHFEGPFGNLSGSLEFQATEGGFPYAELNLRDSAWGIAEVKPYLLGFLPEEAKIWLDQHLLSMGSAKDLYVHTRFDVYSEEAQLSDALTFQVTADLEGIHVDPYEDFPTITEGKGKLRFGLDFLEIDVHEAMMPGGVIDSGNLRLGHGVPKATPLSIQASGLLDAAEAWDKIQPVWSDEIPVLQQFQFEKETDASFLLRTQDLGGDAPFEMDLELSPRKGNAFFEYSGVSQKFEHIEGVLRVTLDELLFEDLSFHKSEIRGEINGNLSYEDSDVSHIQVYLDHLESLFPKLPHASPEGNKKWFPERLSAYVDVTQEVGQGKENQPWLLQILAIDEREQRLSTKLSIEDQGVVLDNLSGRAGQLELQGYLDFINQSGALNVNVDDEQHPVRFQTEWTGQDAQVSLWMQEWSWMHWSQFELSPVLLSFIPPGDEASHFPIKEWSFEVDISEFFTSKSDHFPVEAKGQLGIHGLYDLAVETLRIGEEQGEALYQGSLKEGILDVSWEAADVQTWIERLLWADWSFLEDDPLEPPSELFQNLSVNVDTPQLKLPGNPAVPVLAQLQVIKHPDWLDVHINKLSLDDNLSIGHLHYEGKQLSLDMNTETLDLLRWVNFIRMLDWPKTPPSEDPPVLTVEVSAEISQLYLTPAVSLPASANTKVRIGQGTKPHHITLQQVRFGEHHATGVVEIGDGLHQIDMKLHQFRLDKHIDQWVQVDWGTWLDSTLVGTPKPSKHEVKLHFAVNKFGVSQASEHFPLKAVGTAYVRPQSTLMKLPQVSWGDQKGTLQYEFGDQISDVKAVFDFLDFGVLVDIARLWKTKHTEHVPVPSELSKLDSFAFRLPERPWNVDLQAHRLKFLKSSFDDLEINAGGDTSDIRINRISWNLEGQEQFFMRSHLLQDSSEEWNGQVKMKIADLGDLFELLSSMSPERSHQYPIKSGVTYVDGELRLLRAPENHWLPHADINFESRNGIIRRGKSLTFLLAILSIESYYNFVQGKLSSLEGEGLVYNSVKSRLKTKGSLFEVYHFQLVSEVSNIFASGIFNYGKSEQELTICLQPFQTLDLILNNVPIFNWILTSRRGAFIEACLNSSGDFENPSLFLLPQSIFLLGKLRDLAIFDYEQLQGAESNPPEEVMVSPVMP